MMFSGRVPIGASGELSASRTVEIALSWREER